MAEDFIEAIYKKSYLITMMKKMAENCRQRKLQNFWCQWEENIEDLATVCRETAQINGELGVEIWDELQVICKLIDAEKFVEVADRLESLIPDFQRTVEIDGNIDVTDDIYRLYSTKSGFLNIEFTDTNLKIYSDIDPVWEKYELAKGLYQPKMKNFILIGCGLGYLPWQMYDITRGSVDIHVYELDENVISYATNYGALGQVPEDKIHITVCNDINRLLKKCVEHTETDDNESVLYVEDYIYNQLSDSDRSALQQLKLTIQTGLDFGDICELNYFRNNMAVNQYISDCDFSNCPKEWIVLGGGPSLDENIEYLKGQKGKKTIVAATTVLGKILKLGIEPDFVAVQDPQNRTYGHMKGIESSKTVMFLTESANWQFGEKYQGDKYLVKTDGNYYSNNDNKDLWETYGTVTAFEIDIAAYAGATSIELMGVDLAYPGEQTHASDTMDNRSVDSTGMIKVKSVDGGEVPTSVLFKGYIDDIEHQIKKYKKVRFYNLSEHGAYIAGCIS